MLALPLAGVSKGWRKAVADRVTPRVAARTPLEDHHVRAVLGAVFIGLSTYYVVGSVRRFLGASPPGALGQRQPRLRRSTEDWQTV